MSPLLSLLSKQYDNLLSISIHEEEIVLGQDMKITSFSR